jgi:hypothetical protein
LNEKTSLLVPERGFCNWVSKMPMAQIQARALFCRVKMPGTLASGNESMIWV